MQDSPNREDRKEPRSSRRETGDFSAVIRVPAEVTNNLQGRSAATVGSASKQSEEKRDLSSNIIPISDHRSYGRRTLATIFDARVLGVVTAFLLACVVTAAAEDLPKPAAAVTPLDRGFSGLYNLDFAGAQTDFALWQAQHPDDPVGPVSEAAGLLFSEFNRLGVLEAQFFENDEAFV